MPTQSHARRFSTISGTRPLHITGEAFDRVAWHLQRTLQDLEVQQEDQQVILAAVQARRDQVVTFEES
jgi:truncated hemoglobin YjbI